MDNFFALHILLCCIMLQSTYLLTYLHTYSMEHSPSWEANRFKKKKKISRILWNSNVHYCIHKCLQVRGFLCEHFVTRYVFTAKSCWHLAQPPSWRSTPCRLSATAYLIYCRLPSILEAVPPSATRRRALPWWQGPTYHELQCSRLLNYHPLNYLIIGMLVRSNYRKECFSQN
jgi:hypothetical protein